MEEYQMLRNIADDLFYLGVDDTKTDLFESAYPIPRGVTYNSYLLLDEKTALFDTVDEREGEAFFHHLNEALGGRPLDYVVVHHMEPDHSGTLARLLKAHPETTAVMTKKAAVMFGQFFDLDISSRLMEVKEGTELSLGWHELVFTLAPMVHWPEVALSFDKTTGWLFAADAFGTFGALRGKLFADEVSFEEDWLPDARRYYTNIVGKYGTPVQNVLKKAAKLPITMILPLHGPIWRENLSWFIGKYDQWSRYQAEDNEAAIFAGSVYGHTLQAAKKLAKALSARGVAARVYDAAREDLSFLVAEAFRAKVLVFASATYNNGIFTPMEHLLMDLKAHDLQNRPFALMENGTWAPNSGKLMLEILSGLKNCPQLGETLTMKSSLQENQVEQVDALAEEIRKAMEA